MLTPVLSRFWDQPNPWTLSTYLWHDGYQGLRKALDMTPDEVIAEIKDSGLRGRGGAGFPTYKKWEIMRAQANTSRVIICNADEGDPGAYMNRNEIESDPHMLVEASEDIFG